MNPREINTASTTILQISCGIQMHARTCTQRSISHSIPINMEQTPPRSTPPLHLPVINFTRHKHIISVDISYRYICTLSVLLHLPRSTPSSFSKYSMSIPSTSSSPLTAWHHVLLRLLAHSWWPPLPPPIGNLITKIYSSMMSKSCNMHCFSELSFCGNVTHSTRHPYISGWLNFAWHSNNLHVLYHCASVNLFRASPHPPLS